MASARVIGNRVEAAYTRGDLFETHRALAEACSAFCAVSPAGVAMVPLHARAG
jgi:hypothetical protein